MSFACQAGRARFAACAAVRHQELRELKGGGRNVPASALSYSASAVIALAWATQPSRRLGSRPLSPILVRGVVIEFGELPVMEDAEVVELLLDRAGHAGELLEIVGGTARPGKTLEGRRLRRHRDFPRGPG